MKKSLKMRLLSLIIITSFLTSVSAQQITTNVTNSWFGNTSPDPETFMPQGIEAMFVSPDGTVYTNVYWEEGSGNLTKISAMFDVMDRDAASL